LDKTFHHVREITGTLVEHFGRQTLGNKQDPFDELLYIILSSKTPPLRYEKAYQNLKRHYPNNDDLHTADQSALASAIRFAGLEYKKAGQIIAIATLLERQFGAATLDPLRQWSTHEAENMLLTLPGIGIKSARCILLYSLGRLVFPADNHCLRIAERLHWIAKATFTKVVANYLQDHIPPKLRKDLHVGMVLLGRDYCVPKNPHCSACPILAYCPTGLQRTQKAETS
jgi:endonuclease III